MAKAGERMDLVVVLPIRQSAEGVPAPSDWETHQISQKAIQGWRRSAALRLAGSVHTAWFGVEHSQKWRKHRSLVWVGEGRQGSKMCRMFLFLQDKVGPIPESGNG